MNKANNDKGNSRVAVGKGKVTETSEKVYFRFGIVITQQGMLVTNITIFIQVRTGMAECAEFTVVAVV